MSEERSLTDFSSTEPVGSKDSQEDSVNNKNVDKASNRSTETEPATITYRWQPDGAICSQCETSTQKQWLNDGQFVCPDCKTWDNA